MENLRSQLAPVRELVQRGDLRLEDIELHVGLRFQFGASVFRVEQLPTAESVLAKCVYGTNKGSQTLFESIIVARAILERRTK